MTRVVALCALALTTGCLTGSYIEPHPLFGEPTAVSSPLDEEGGSFDGARLSPGFGILYRAGYTFETARNTQCGGYFPEEPGHILELGYAMQLKVSVHSDDALAMKIVAPNGDATCAEPPSTVNENVSYTSYLAPGRYEVWVGSTQPHTSSTYRLVLSE